MHRTYEKPMTPMKGKPANRILVKSHSNANQRLFWEPYKNVSILFTLEKRDREDLPWTQTQWVG